jgi:3-hydroxyacyl-[acyl-carrier-protein] dehydratase
MAPDHPAADGHFPGNPIIPGAVLLQEIVSAIGTGTQGMICRQIASAKFLHPVRPGDLLAIDWSDSPNGDIRFICAISPSGPRVVTGALRFGPP